MKGYRVLIVNVVALGASLLAMNGIEVTADQQGAISTGILALVNIGLRMITTTPVGKSE